MNGVHKRIFLITVSLMAVFSFVFILSLVRANNVTLQITVIPHPQCNDGIDNDSDGFTDYPDDTDCLSYTDNNEGVHPVVTPTPTSTPSHGGGGGGGGSNNAANEIIYSEKMIFKGKAYPGANVTLLKDAQVSGTVLADKNGNFEIRISDISNGTYVFGIWAEDSIGNKSTVHNFILAVLSNQTMVVSGIILPTTITTDKAEVRKGDDVKIYGFTYPSANVDVYVHSAQEIQQTALADSDGFWQYNLNTTPLDMETHSARSKSKSGADTSIFSEPVTFIVGDKNIIRDNPVLTKKIKTDLNGDSRINLVDYSILAYWYKRAGFPKDLDFNSDGKIDLIDFSIMAYYWTG